MGYVVRQTLSTELSPAPKNVTSMINLKMVASPADPKNDSMSSSEVLSLEPSYKEKHVVRLTEKSKASQGGNPEQNEASRKNKKKKEKSKSKYEVLTVQEPPRIEDAEEFPNLAVASERRDRVESPKFQSKQQPQNNFKNSRKKSQIPVQLDLGGMLTALEKKQHSLNAKQSSKPVVFSVGAVPVLSKDSMSGKKGHRLAQVKTPHNPLDSTSPMMKKGKQREVPKAKKPTPLKKIILKERQERKQQRLHENALSPAFPSDDVQDVQDEESGGDDQVLRPPDVLGETKESVSCVPVAESKSEEQLGAEPQKETEACPKIHSRRFRDYCSQMLSKEVDACVTDLLKELVRFQDRMYQKDPVKAKAKRRLVLGLREVLKHLKLRKLKCIIISPNCEKIQSKVPLGCTSAFREPVQIPVLHLSGCCFQSQHSRFPDLSAASRGPWAAAGPAHGQPHGLIPILAGGSSSPCHRKGLSGLSLLLYTGSVLTAIPWQTLGFTRITPPALSQLPDPPLKVVGASGILRLLLWGHSSFVPPMQLSPWGCVFWWAVLFAVSHILPCLAARASPRQWLTRKNGRMSRRWCLKSSLSNF
ncbi:selenocysteine insertion sequence-binding protein 2-like isoform X1 [Moschus berezovskii]|uniref:selenocysteine insertion sequence-binding protein 2-like isoform X1 n=1 Tax=Moschus berezovskii TaxID=68408 RepID=UPI002444A43C|nr:selenocysteine insertion sequence-binding protein 2-like isoform X1 [Moschus berezovskii]XP_055283495.1 selenocysteine insertion sequence-binding protein 2-like isoform X1 [Moschus berezovskii]